ncbi:hypothetical protein EDC04DRAFT_2600306 [Pisolithus marmoratus]|nr:hypothetical protein EDC04DRAFT_2600306 [Pisolithus marmoratus]
MSMAVLGMWQPPFWEYIWSILILPHWHGSLRVPGRCLKLFRGSSDGPAHPMACDEFPKPFGAHLEEARWPYGNTAYGLEVAMAMWPHEHGHSICALGGSALPSGVICTFGSPSAPPDRILLRCFINILLDLQSQNSILEHVAYEFHSQLADNGKNGMKMREVRVDSQGYYTLELIPKLEMTLENDLDDGV